MPSTGRPMNRCSTKITMRKKEEKETGKEEREVADEYEAEDTHMDNIMQPETALKVSDVKKNTSE